jgi:hypothetical protein
MSLYGITDAKQLALEFDGERVGDGQTPQSLGIEDDDLIEVKVSGAEQPGCMCCAACVRSYATRGVNQYDNGACARHPVQDCKPI